MQRTAVGAARLRRTSRRGSSRRPPRRKSTGRSSICSVEDMPARYRVRIRGRSLTVWDDDERSAVETATEWLDAIEKAGLREDLTATVERIGDEPEPDDLIGNR